MKQQYGTPYPSGIDKLILVSPSLLVKQPKKVKHKDIVHIKAQLSATHKNHMFLDRDFLKANELDENFVCQNAMALDLIKKLVAIDKRSFLEKFSHLTDA